jgi:hypothetical protein
VPLLAVLLDYLENAGIAAVLAPVTAAKNIAYAASLALVAGAAVWAVVARLRAGR